MATVTSDILTLTLAGVKTDFDAAYRQYSASAEWNAVASEIQTTLPTQKYGMLGASAVMGLYKGRSEEQPINELDQGYSISDALFDAMMPIQRTAIEDDQYGLIQLRTQSLGQEAVRHDNEIVFTALVNGFSAQCYDGQYFFDSDHAEGDSGTQSNVTNAPLSDPALETARATMRLIKNDKGKPMGINPNVLAVGPKLERRATDLMGSDVVVVRIGDGTAGSGATAATPYTNFWKAKAVVIVSEYIQNFNWFLLDATRPVKPIILQKRKDVPLTIESDMTEPSAMMKEEWKVRVRERKQVGYSLWQLAYGSNASS